jgi:hypothetical protein
MQEHPVITAKPEYIRGDIHEYQRYKGKTSYV